jgi:hypothetical protein
VTVTPAALVGPTQLGTSIAALYTAPGATKATVSRAVFTNVTGGAVTFTVEVVRSGGSTGTDKIVISAQSVAAGAAYVAPELERLVLATGDSIQALASAATSINAIISGFTSA